MTTTPYQIDSLLENTETNNFYFVDKVVVSLNEEGEPERTLYTLRRVCTDESSTLECEVVHGPLYRKVR